MKYYAGVDLGGTNTKIGLLDKSGKILIKETIKTFSGKGMETTLKRIWETIEKLMAEKKINKEKIGGIGIGIPGPVINQEIVAFFANFDWEANINISKAMEKISGVPTKLENDVNMIAIGESKFGAGKGSASSITVALGTGVGGGIVVNSKLISGISGAGGEIGHMKLVENGKLCGCGQRGCFETYASATGVIREAKSRLAINKNNLLYKSLEGNMEKLEAKDVFDCAKAGDEFSMEIVNYVGNYLGMGIGNLLNIINPEIIILSGGVALAGEILLDVVTEKLKQYALPVTLVNLEIKLGELGNDAGIKGGIALFL
ncbi:MAG: ROK family protein [Psychrilyobacter sp.]|uniref:ROK family protein n=1 Tax=Psychrilyobacter sp. TaxID=2586924 RepID=UPI003C763179